MYENRPLLLSAGSGGFILLNLDYSLNIWKLILIHQHLYRLSGYQGNVRICGSADNFESPQSLAIYSYIPVFLLSVNLWSAYWPAHNSNSQLVVVKLIWVMLLGMAMNCRVNIMDWKHRR